MLEPFLFDLLQQLLGTGSFLSVSFVNQHVQK